MSQANPKRIAILRALQLGDMLAAVPAFRAIRRQLPEAEITLIGLPWAAAFARRFARYIDRFIEFPGYPGIAEVPFDAARTAPFLEEQRAYGYDIVVQMHGSGQVSNRFVLDLNGRSTVGYYQGKRPPGLTVAAPYPDEEHEIVRNLGLANLLGSPKEGDAINQDIWGERDKSRSDALKRVPTKDGGTKDGGTKDGGTKDGRDWVGIGSEGVGARGGVAVERGPGACPGACPAEGAGSEGMDVRLEFLLYEEDYAEAAALLKLLPTGRRPRVGMHVGARPPARRWPLEHFAALADELVRFFNAEVLLTGGPDEKTMVRGVLERMETRAINLAGKTSLGGLAALMRKLDLFVSNDTGPAHLAVAVDCPSVTIFGPAEPQRWAPLDRERHPIVRYGVVCSPCGYWQCPIDHRCLRWVSPAMVLEAAEGLLPVGMRSSEMYGGKR
jgi:ADP-heptose:LPS heptosyltransferase